MAARSLPCRLRTNFTPHIRPDDSARWVQRCRPHLRVGPADKNERALSRSGPVRVEMRDDGKLASDPQC